MDIRQQIISKREEQQKLAALGQALCDVAEKEGRSLSDAEMGALHTYREKMEQLGREIDELLPMAETLNKHLESLKGFPRGDHDNAPPQRSETTAGTRSEPRPMWRSAGQFMVDFIGSFPNKLNGGETRAGSVDRIAAHNQAVEAQARDQQTTNDTVGLLPVNVVGEISTDVDGDRPYITALGVKQLANITGKTFNRPVVTQHTEADIQNPEGAPLVTQKMIVDDIPFPKKTVGGWVEITRQDIDWTDPNAWDALISDMAGIYAETSEDAAVQEHLAQITQGTAMATNDIQGLVAALYDAAFICLTAAGSKRARTRRMPNMLITSSDMWRDIGKLIDLARVQVNPEESGLGSGGISTINGTMLDVPRIMVPGLPAGTILVGSTRYAEFYEQRVGVLQAVRPSTFGVEVAYGGYTASGLLDATAFCKITKANPPPLREGDVAYGVKPAGNRDNRPTRGKPADEA